MQWTDAVDSNYGSALPPEIWREILRWATSLAQGPPECDFLQSPFAARGEWPFSRPDLRATKRDKISVSFVCRAWRELTRPFLFEILRIVTSRLPPLPSRNNVESSSDLFAYAQHLKVIHDYPPAAPSLRRILELCTNVRRIRYDLVIQRGETQTLPDLFPVPTLSSLRYLYFYDRSGCEASLLSHICTAAPQLRVLRYSGTLVPPRLNQVVTMSHVRSLELSIWVARGPGGCFTSYHFPQLRYLANHSPVNVTMIAPHSLHPLAYDARGLYHHAFFDFERLAMAKPTTAIVARNIVVPQPINRRVLPSVCQIIIAARSRALDTEIEPARVGVLAGIFKCFNDPVRFPSLRRVDVLGIAVPIRIAGAEAFWPGWIAKMGANGIQLESHLDDSIIIDAWPAP